MKEIIQVDCPRCHYHYLWDTEDWLFAELRYKFEQWRETRHAFDYTEDEDVERVSEQYYDDSDR